MALRNIRKEKEKCLYAISRKVEKFDDRLKELVADMTETNKNADGAGLAAPQVGILKRVIIVDTGEETYPLINPEFTFMSEEKVGAMEGCLSFPGKWGYVLRSKEVIVKAQDPDGNPVERHAFDMEARILQHEIDHLDGIVYLTKVTDPPEGYPDENNI